MKPEENIEKLIKNIDIDTNAKMDKAVRNDVLGAFENSKNKKPAVQHPNIWRIIMKSKITKLSAAAAVIIIAVLIGISSLNGTSAWAKVIKAIKETIYTVEDRVAKEKINRPDLKDKPSGPERIRAHHKTLQIPDDELVSLSTEELLDKITHTSLFIMVIVQPEPDDGLARFARGYNGVNAFLERPDAGKVLLEQYEKLTNEVSQGVQEKDGAFAFRFTIMEVLMSSDRVINQMNDPKQRMRLIASIVNALDARAQYDASQSEPVYGEATLGHSALAVAQYLEASGDPEFKKWYAEKRKTGLFASYEESKEVISIARKHIQQQQTERKTPSP